MTAAFYNGGVRVVDLSGLSGISLGSSQLVGEGMKEIGYYRMPDADTWSAKTPQINRKTGDFYLFGNDMNARPRHLPLPGRGQEAEEPRQVDERAGGEGGARRAAVAGRGGHDLRLPAGRIAPALDSRRCSSPAGRSERWTRLPPSWGSWRFGARGSSTTRRRARDVSSSASAACSPASRTRTSTSRPGRSGCARHGSRARARSRRRSTAWWRRGERVPQGGWLRGLGWREGDWADAPTREALDRAVSDVPVALMSKDYHSLWLNSAALERADAPLEVPGGVVEPSGILRENSAWQFRDRYVRPTRRRDDRGLARGDEGGGVARRRGDPRQGRLARSLRGLRAAARGGRARRARMAVVPLGPARRAERARPALGVRQRHASHGLPEGLHGRDARLGDRAPARRLGRRDQLARAARGRGAPRSGGRLARGGARDRRRARTALRSTPSRPRARRGQPRGLRQRIEHAQLLDEADVARFAEIGVAASVQFSHAPSDRDLAERLWEGRQGAYAYRSLLDAGALLANGSDAPVEELDPLAGIVAGVLRTLDERPAWRPEQARHRRGGAPRDAA